MKNTSIQKAIEVAELEKDLAQLMAQAHTINGAIQYIKQKIDGLAQKESENLDGKAKEMSEAKKGV